MNATFIGFSTLFAVVVLLSSGCSHQLDVKNLSSYRNIQITPLPKPLTVGVVPDAEDIDSMRLVKSVVTNLGKYSIVSVFPFSATGTSMVDVVANITIRPEYKGSGLNFLINWPGFLIFMPAINGYIYEANYDVEVMLTEAAGDSKIDTWSIPIRLNLRHADMNRTWTEVGWLEVSVIPLIGGIFFTQYDHSVTPILVDKIESPIGDYIASEIVARINQAEPIVRRSQFAQGRDRSVRKDPEVKVSYDESGKGWISIDTREIGFDAAKAQAIKNIEKIVTSRGIAIKVGEKPSGGRYILKNEEVKNGYLKIEFETVD